MNQDSGRAGGDFIASSDEKRVIEIVAQSVQGLWEVVNNLTRPPTVLGKYLLTRGVAGFISPFGILASAAMIVRQ
jgi:hypothetical protein